jgi:transaldolase
MKESSMKHAGKYTDLSSKLSESIRKEGERLTQYRPEDLWSLILDGSEETARGALLYFSTEETFRSLMQLLDTYCREKLSKITQAEGNSVLRFLLNLSLDLKTFPAERKLLPLLGEETLQKVSLQVLTLLQTVARSFPNAECAIKDEIKKQTLARLKAEGLSGDSVIEKEAEKVLGANLQEYVENLSREMNASNLLEAAREAQKGILRTEIGNDYAEFLDYMIRIGGSFVTTNPVLIKLAWDIDPEYWNRRVDEVIGATYGTKKLSTLLSGPEEKLTEAVETINTLVTIAVVERNCRLLRPLFLLSEGKQGYVSLQVNPKAHKDGSKMVEEAVFIYQELERRLGGVPNVVIKVPSTAAGLYAAEQLTSRGIGVTVTLTFSLFQSLPFSEVLQKGNALISYIAIMNGRLAFPVRDELKAAGVPGGVEASRWAGVEVARKTSYRLYSGKEQGGLGVDPGKVKIMIASLRIYEDWIPDISELWGIPLITIFPNVRRTYDSHPRELVPDSLQGKTPEKDVEVLLKSEIFRQAWWVPENGSLGKPQRVLTLEQADAEAVAEWKPVKETLTQFIGMYQEMSLMVKERMRVLSRN